MTAALLAFAAGAAGIAAAECLIPAARLPVARLARPNLLKLKLATGMACAAGGLLVGALLPGRLGLLVAGASPLAGFFVPDLWLARRDRERREAARRDLPALLDLLRLAVEAGASLPEALAEVGRRSTAPLAGRWRAVAAQVAVGVPLMDALEHHRRELPMPELDSLVGALGRAARHGAPLSDTLAAQARHARLARRRAVQERAAKAAPKMQLVVALLLVPSVMLIVAAGLLSALVSGGAEGVFTF